MTDWRPAARALGLPADTRALLRLGEGPVTDSWLLEADGVKRVLRLDRPVVKTLGLDRHAEWQHLQLAFDAGIAPEPLAFDPARGSLLTEHLDGEEPSAALLDWAELGALLRRLHALPAPGAKAFDPLSIAQTYAAAAGGPEAERELTVVKALAPAFSGSAGSSLCHNDAHFGNILSFGTGADGLRLIDWEYAAAGDPVFDLVVPCRFHGLQEQQLERLCTGWGDAGLFRSAHWARAMALYDALTALWAAAVQR